MCSVQGDFSCILWEETKKQSLKLPPYCTREGSYLQVMSRSSFNLTVTYGIIIVMRWSLITMSVIQSCAVVGIWPVTLTLLPVRTRDPRLLEFMHYISSKVVKIHIFCKEGLCCFVWTRYRRGGALAYWLAVSYYIPGGWPPWPGYTIALTCLKCIYYYYIF